MDSYNLDLNSYSLEELLELFAVSLPITGMDIAAAKRKAFRSHPDMSGLHNDIFVFYKAAFHKLESLYKIQIDQNRCTRDKYDELDLEKNASIESFSQSADFIERFNGLFEEVVVSNMQTPGHGAWLAETDNSVDTTTSQNFDKLKQQSRSLALVDAVVGVAGSDTSSSLIETDCNSGTCGGLIYEDVKKAYTETLVPVTEEQDYLRRKRYTSVQHLELDRKLSISSESYDNHEAKLEEQHNRDNLLNYEMAFKLQKEDERRKGLGHIAESRMLRIRGI